MAKRILLIIIALEILTITLLVSCAAPSPKLTETEGRLLLSEDGSALLIPPDGAPIVLSVQTDGGAPFADYHTGDRITVTHDGLDDSYPMQTGAYSWELLEEGTLEDIPPETLESLEALGWDFGRDIHEPAEEPQLIPDPPAGYCGNTVTKVTLDESEYSFWGSDSVALTSLLESLLYDPERICRCLPEFDVTTEFGITYGVNLTETYVRTEAGQAPLTAGQAEEIQAIIARNCVQQSGSAEQ